MLVYIGVQCYRKYVELPARTQDAQRNFATIRYHQLFYMIRHVEISCPV
jgi:hypothetical protein